MKNKPKLSQVQLEAKILLAKSILKNWDQATEQEKKEIKRWWNTKYCLKNQKNLWGV